MPRPTCIVCGFDSGGGPLCEFDAKTYPQVAGVIAERDRLIDERATLARKLDAVRAAIADYNKDCDCWKRDGPCESCYASSSLLAQFKSILDRP